MKNTYAIAAIAMVAVIMGLSSFAPTAMATPSEEKGNGTHNPKNLYCHFDRDVNDDQTVEGVGSDDRQWEVKRLNAHSSVAHLAHGDIVIGDGTGGTVLEGNCNKAFLGDPDA